MANELPGVGSGDSVPNSVAAPDAPPGLSPDAVSDTPVSDPAIQPGAATPGQGPARDPAAVASDDLDKKIAEAEQAISSGSHNPADHPNGESPFLQSERVKAEQANSIDAQIAQQESALGLTGQPDPTAPAAGTPGASAKKDPFGPDSLMFRDANQAKTNGDMVAGAGKYIEDAGHAVIVGLHGAEQWLSGFGIGRGDLLDPTKRTHLIDSFMPELAQDEDSRANRAAGKFVAQTAALLAGGAGGGGMAVSLMRGAGVNAAISFLGADPDQKNLSDWVQDHPAISNPIAAMLAVHPDDTEMDARTRQALNSLVQDGALGAAAFGMLKTYQWGAQALRDAQAGRKAAAVAQDAAQTAKAAGAVGEQAAASAAAREAKAAKAAAGNPLPADLQGATADMPLGAPKVGETFAQAQKRMIDFNPDMHSGDVEQALANSRINWGALPVTADAKDFTQKIVAANPAFFEAAQGHRTVDEITATAAKLLGEDPTALFQKKLGEGFSTNEIAQSYIVLNKLSDDYKVLNTRNAELIANGTINDSHLAEMAEARDRLTQAVLLNRVGGSETGRALNQYKFARDALPPDILANADYQKARVALEGGSQKMTFATQQFEAMQKSGNFDAMPQLLNYMEKNPFRRTSDAVASFVRGNLLAASHVTVAVANTLSTVRGVAERFGAEFLPSAAAELQKVQGGEAGVMARSLVDSMAEAAAARYKDIKDFKIPNSMQEVKDRISSLAAHEPSSLYGQSIGFSPNPSISAINAGVDPETFWGKTIDAIGRVVDAPGRGVQTIDDYGRMMNAQAHLRSLAHREATVAQAAGQNYKEVFDAFMASPTANRVRESIDYGAKVTFQNPLSGWTQQLGQLSKDNTWQGAYIGRFIQPFFNTGVNEMTAGIQASPVGFGYAMAAKAGADSQLMASRATIGTMMMAAGAGLYESGHLTGGGPANPKSNALWREAGNEPYSLKLGDLSVSLHKLGPWGRSLSLMADAAEIFHNSGNGSVAPQVMASLVKEFTPDFMVQNYGQLADAMRSGEFANYIGRKSTMFVPGSSALRVLRKEVDPVARSTYVKENAEWGIPQAIKNNWMNNIPWLSKDLTPHRNLFGDAVHYDRSIVSDQASATYGAEPDAALKEMVRLGQTGMLVRPDVPGADKALIVSKPSRTIVSNGGSVQLDDKQYDQLQQYAAKPADGVPDLRQALNSFVKSPEYKDMPDPAKKARFSAIVRRYQSAGRNRLMQEDSTIQDKLIQQKQVHGEIMQGIDNGGGQ